jgi:hypothetical protein
MNNEMLAVLSKDFVATSSFEQFTQSIIELCGSNRLVLSMNASQCSIFEFQDRPTRTDLPNPLSRSKFRAVLARFCALLPEDGMNVYERKGRLRYGDARQGGYVDVEISNCPNKLSLSVSCKNLQSQIVEEMHRVPTAISASSMESPI